MFKKHIWNQLELKATYNEVKVFKLIAIILFTILLCVVLFDTHEQNKWITTDSVGGNLNG